mgnify:CR=1 FL=1
MKLTEFNNKTVSNAKKALKEHFLNEHGIQLSSWIGLLGAEIVNEKKYTMFLLKYSC